MPFAKQESTPDAAAPADAADARDEHPAMVAIYGEPSVLIVDTIRFDLGSVRLDKDTTTTLEAVAEAVRVHGFVVEVEGHSDPVEKAADLGAKRARLVLDRLIELGVPPDQLSVKDYGASRPLDPNSKAVNARVSFRIVSTPSGDR